MMWTDDPVKDAKRYSHRMDKEYEDAEENDKHPVCCECENDVFDIDDHYYVFDCRVYCADCVDGHKIYM